MALDLDEKFIISAENKLAVTFPASYRLSMMQNNGGCVISPNGEEAGVWFLFSFLDSSDKKCLKRTAVDIVRENHTAWNDYGLPKNLYAIGNADEEYLVFNKKDDNTLEDTVYIFNPQDGLIELAADFKLLTHE